MKYKNKNNKKMMINNQIIYSNKDIQKSFYNISNYFINIVQKCIK